MKQHRLLWMLMLVLLVPALALSGCDSKKKKSRDNDDDESTEKSEKKKTDIDISGEYELDDESAKMLLGESASSLGEDAKVKCVMNLVDGNELRMEWKVDFSMPTPEIDNTVFFNINVLCKGSWEYDKQDKLLTVDFESAEMSGCDISFARDDSQSRAVIKELGGIEGFRSQMEQEINPDDFIGANEEFKITELTDFGFYARSTKGKSQKVKFVRRD